MGDDSVDCLWFFALGGESCDSDNAFCRDAAGTDGLLVTDVPVEEAREVKAVIKRFGLAFIPL